ncbi:CaiB/BaiF CoA transferase family protein [Mycolicibacterium goodii]|uniref:CoA transferase n=1 Tax=Mycolicibacterium goodii TaxID=134601 RepID=A0ABS6HK20_MYCGD|nr:CaiB/BaiF CoA-transferase family protein [Mycolicibacterium goodii]MBU8815561.1 CoA transferase [Mycolicibacterium goodii]MBU8823033.1 CoA transferase [Mycolicibacterium goodii]MBU8837526.1 CoA transferase [Mycolicibacterium goodii]
MAMLDGIRVVSFTHFLQGPSATQMLADLGAHVIKVEPPTGAFERSWSGPDAYLNGESVFFLLGNRNVDSLVVDLKDPEWVDAVIRLLDEADVLIESFRPGVMDRLGLGWERLRDRNPRLVYCSLSGYGSDGPYKDRPGQDVLLQSLSGIAAATGTADDPPTPVGASVVDQHGAVLGAFGILAALHGRERTGRGARVESNLLSAALDLQIEPLSYFLNGYTGRRSGSGVSSPYYKAPYGVFATADGHLTLSLNALTVLAAVFEDDWFLGIGEDSSYDRREDVNERVAKHMAQRTTEDWSAVFAAAGVWFAPVNTYADIVEDPQVLHNKSVIEIDHPRAGAVKLLGHPIIYDGQRPGVRSMPPELGSSNRTVLAELGFSATEINRLQAKVGK